MYLILRILSESITNLEIIFFVPYHVLLKYTLICNTIIATEPGTVACDFLMYLDIF